MWPLSPSCCILITIRSITSPGMNRTERKTRMLSMNKVGIVSNNRLIM